VDKASRNSATDSRHGQTLRTAKAVLARLPDVTVETELERTVAKTAAGGVGYRFDPPQTSRPQPAASSESRSRSATLRSELIYVPHNARTHRPHAFGRERVNVKPRRRESPILPSSNLFENPPRRLLDSIAPAVRFITLVVLFAAAGTWIQMFGRHGAPPAKPIDPPTTTVDEHVAPATKTAERPATGSTASGPIGITPEANRRVGSVREDHDYARLRGDVLSVPPTAYGLEAITADAGGRGSSLPRLQTAEVPQNEISAADGPARSINARLNVHDEAAIREASRFNGYIDKTPSR
jgi:hypothetical protein